MGSKTDAITLVIVGCVALVVVGLVMVGWHGPDAGDVGNLAAPGSTDPGTTAPEWVVPGSTASGGAGPGTTTFGGIVPGDAPA